MLSRMSYKYFSVCFTPAALMKPVMPTFRDKAGADKMTSAIAQVVLPPSTFMQQLNCVSSLSTLSYCSYCCSPCSCSFHISHPEMA